MASSNPPHEEDVPPEDEEDLLDAEEAEEEIPEDPDHPMDLDDEEEEIQLQNDSAAHFDSHTDSIFYIAQHPIHPSIVATGGGDDVGYIFDSTVPDGPLLPTSYESNPQPQAERKSIQPLMKLEGHTDSVNGVTFTLPRGEYVVTAGLDGRLRTWRDISTQKNGSSWKFVAETQEVQEINWIAPCPNPKYENTIALGANDGSVWVYTINANDSETPLTIVQVFYLQTDSSTAGAWTPDGLLLASVSEEGSFFVYDVFGEAAAAGLSSATSQSVVSLGPEDQRFAVEGGLFSVAISPTGTFAAVGGAGGNIKIVGLPRIGAEATGTSGQKGGGAKSKAGGGKKSGGPSAGPASAGQAGQILASLQAQSEGVETLAFSQPPLTLLAAGSVDGSIALFDTAHRFAVRRHIREAHEEPHAVIKVEFANNARVGGSFLTSCGNDGVVRRWDTRGGTTAAGQGFVREWKGHRGDGEGGGALGFVQGGGAETIVTAGDDGVSLVFKADFA